MSGGVQVFETVSGFAMAAPPSSRLSQSETLAGAMTALNEITNKAFSDAPATPLQYARTDRLAGRLATKLAANGLLHASAQTDDATAALAELCTRQKRLTASLDPTQRLNALERLAGLEVERLAFAWPAKPTTWHVERLAQSSWDHAAAIVGVVEARLEGQVVSSSAIKRAFRRAVEQRSPEPGEACVAMLEEALGRTGAA